MINQIRPVLMCPCEKGLLNEKGTVWECSSNSNHKFTMEDAGRFIKKGKVLSGEAAKGIKVKQVYRWDTNKAKTNEKREVYPEKE
ncbi:MAG: hypothetical protein HQL29_06435 [Candidatus Omnitrophica bacterium]|nr:hypothetical protein [Candidatus Omnitrophota bacterium]